MTASSRGSSGWKRQSERDGEGWQQGGFLRETCRHDKPPASPPPGGACGRETAGVFVYSFNM